MTLEHFSTKTWKTVEYSHSKQVKTEKAGNSVASPPSRQQLDKAAKACGKGVENPRGKFEAKSAAKGQDEFDIEAKQAEHRAVIEVLGTRTLLGRCNQRIPSGYVSVVCKRHCTTVDVEFVEHKAERYAGKCLNMEAGVRKYWHRGRKPRSERRQLQDMNKERLSESGQLLGGIRYSHLQPDARSVYQVAVPPRDTKAQ
ncbi:hypothetical protein GE21DRAFT_2596 [Neurospora crassa]|uniref:Uncharacterized protein n=1 Tax=Neurospora crassa (strain ATCC 24698 / 74-OR23-1A / CBS 708.71 / DSM 1257 / FGSC 987) TaxID=367110 RepID=Q7SFK4_NEUCR|nr:hypothetical protein NCU08614 [Neurospora crassa OR74A]EAA35586.1 hypothetical protein NCU08614 [Neurospora crassa OR74A]KHE81245.1 hypothetical protein GE21DRAFT_2596 [Neurospora crassa]|eukprot:XP_964822.1 hypothetical protein NCU08614 [Neurospora crassa OR74A]